MQIDAIKAIIAKIYTNQDFDESACVLAKLTGGMVVVVSWNAEGGGREHCSLVRIPDGRLFDLYGWVDRDEFGKRPDKPGPIQQEEIDPDVTSLERMERVRIIQMAHGLPYGPFNEPWFQEIPWQPVADYVAPLHDEPSHPTFR
jgi:hypothetical protein